MVARRWISSPQPSASASVIDPIRLKPVATPVAAPVLPQSLWLYLTGFAVFAVARN
jgi:hypothetical protein